jgi:uncharacterized membrane protein
MTMASKADRLVADYLKRLDAELRDLPRARRRELHQEISEHIADARADLEEDESSVRGLLDRLGDPEEIAAEARERFGVQRKSGNIDVLALILLLIGGVVLPLIGWLVGVVLLWTSSVWTQREKLIGTLVVPGGLALPFFLMTFSMTSEACSSLNGGDVVCSGGPSLARQVLTILLVAFLVIAPIVTTIFLARRRSVATA